MKKYSQMTHHILVGFITLAVFAVSGVLTRPIQAQEASTNYKGSGRDPFETYRPPVRRKAGAAAVKSAALPVSVPAIKDRIAAYKAQKQAAMMAQKSAPKPTTALLLSELQVIGINRTPRGYAAMVEATPIKLTYVVYPGEVFYDGMLVAIEENRLVFRRETRWTDGRREVAVETKPLRQPNPVEDTMTAPKSSSATSPMSEAAPRETVEAPSPTKVGH